MSSAIGMSRSMRARMLGKAALPAGVAPTALAISLWLAAKSSRLRSVDLSFSSRESSVRVSASRWSVSR